MSPQELETYKDVPVLTVLVLMSSELQKVPIKPRIFPEQTTICSKAFFLLCAQWSVLLLVCLPGTREASYSSLVERIPESPAEAVLEIISTLFLIIITI